MDRKKDFNSCFLAFYLNWGIIIGILKGIFVTMLECDDVYFVYVARGLYISLLFIIAVRGFQRTAKGIKYIVSLFFIWLFLYGITLLLLPEILKIAPKTLFYTVNNVLAVIFIFLQIETIENLEKGLIRYIPLGVVYSVVQWIEFSKTGLYSMEFSYSTIILALLSLSLFIYKNEKKYGVVFLVFFIVNLRTGSRGSLLCYVVFSLLLILLADSRKKSFMLLNVITLLGTIFYMSFQKIFEWLYSIFPESRTIKLFAEGEVFYLSGRENYYRFIIGEIKEAPLRFRGLYSDRIYLAKYFGTVDTSQIYGSYTHNFFLEILFQFGLLAGIILLTICIICIIKCIHIVKRSENISLKCVYIVFASYCIGQLMVSNSYLTALSFGIYFGMTILLLNRGNCKHINKKNIV